MEAGTKHTGCDSQEGPPAGLPEDLGWCLQALCVCISVGVGGGHGFWAGETPRRVTEDPVARESTCDLRQPRGGAGEAMQTQQSTLQSPKDTARRARRSGFSADHSGRELEKDPLGVPSSSL